MNRSAEGAASVTRQELLELIARHARTVLPNLESHRFSDGDRLQDLGANSVDRAEIGVLVLESLSLQIPRIELFGPRNLGELADLLQKKIGAG
jgi:polyketide biosynthesis acyl carrier protein